MNAAQRREEATNTDLAKSLQGLLGGSFVVTAEQSGRADGRHPDIVVKKHNRQIVLEAKHDDFSAAVAAAQGRWKNMNPAPDIVGAVSYSPPFKAEGFEHAVRQGATVEFALSGDEYQDLAKFKRSGEVYDLAQSLRRPGAIIAPDEDDEIEQAIGQIKGVLAAFTGSVMSHSGVMARLVKILQANVDGGKKEEVLEQTAKMAGLILFGALLFQFELADRNKRVQTPPNVLQKNGISGLAEHWQFILEEINYVAIFKVARDILQANIQTPQIKWLMDAARNVREIARDGVDLMGRLYHYFLADAKPLGAFYTSLPAATLMAGLALNPADWKNYSWADANSVAKLRIADPACGSGTLLAAACWQVLDNFSRAHFAEHGGQFGGKEKEHPRVDLQRALVEQVIWGYDILETAAHLTAATLGLMAPEVDFKKAHIYRAIIGKTDSGTAAGSLELLESNMPIFRRETQVEQVLHNGAIPQLDLCIMNPPFVRGTLGNESFSFLPKVEQNAVHKRMRDLGKAHDFVCDKGQGPAFVALACQVREKESFIKEGGWLAVILPAAVAMGMGSAWKNTRARIEKYFDLEILIVSRDSSRPNFSENTNLQECILIARKRKKADQPTQKALFAVLRRNPRNSEEALATMQAIRAARTSGENIGDLRASAGPPALFSDKQTLGQFALLPYRGQSAWRGSSFANIHLAFVANNFAKDGTLRPFLSRGKISLLPLSNIAAVGSCRLDIYFNGTQIEKPRARINRTLTEYAGYYPGYHKRETGVSQKDLRQISEEPQCYWLPLPGCEEWADNYYANAGRIVLGQSIWFTTACRLAALVSRPVQASCYWPIKLHKQNEKKLKTMTLWLNSTPALLLIVHSSSSTRGAKVKFSQKAAKELPVLDVESLSAEQLKKAAKVFDEIVKSDGLLPLPKMQNDEQRIKIDDLFSDILNLGDLAPLRAALAVEPIITGKAAGVAVASRPS